MVNNCLSKTVINLPAMLVVASVTLSGFVVAPAMSSEQKPGSVEQQVEQSTAPASEPVSVAKSQQSSNDDDVVEAIPAATKKKRTVITLESTFVGDKEQPKVTSIVPWQKAEHKGVTVDAVSQQINMTFKPITVDGLNREIKYYKKSKK